MNLKEAYKKNEDAYETQEALEQLCDNIERSASGHKGVQDFISNIIAYLVYDEFNLEVTELDTANLTVCVDGSDDEYDIADCLTEDYTYEKLLKALGYDSEPDWAKQVDAWRVQSLMNKLGVATEDLSSLPPFRESY